MHDISSTLMTHLIDSSLALYITQGLKVINR